MIQKQYNLAVAPMRGAYDRMTYDADALSSGLAFLESELEKRDPMLREPLTNTTYPRDIVDQTGCAVATLTKISVGVHEFVIIQTNAIVIDLFNGTTGNGAT